MKYEWRKQAKNLYSTKQQPRILTVPAQRFISLHGGVILMALNFSSGCKRCIPWRMA